MLIQPATSKTREAVENLLEQARRVDVRYILCCWARILHTLPMVREAFCLVAACLCTVVRGLIGLASQGYKDEASLRQLA